MEDYFIKNIAWDECTQPINAIDFSASLEELQELKGIVELLGLPFEEDAENIFYSAAQPDGYFTMDVQSNSLHIPTCDDRIAPIPSKYITTLIPMLVLAHREDPLKVIKVYNDFFINKKEEITPLLDQ